MRSRTLDLVTSITLATVAGGALAGCDDSLAKPQEVVNLRIVAVQAEPPEAPAGTEVALSALILHPDPAVVVEQAWAACVIAYGQPSTSCATGATQDVPPPCAEAPDAPVCLLGMDPTATYRLPERAVSGVPAGQAGSVVVTLVAADGPAGGLAGCANAFADPEHAPEGCRVAVKTVRVLPASSGTANANPSIASLAREGDLLTVALGDGAAEMTPDGPEPLFLSWYVTGGELDKFRTDADPEGLSNLWTPPAEPGTYRAAVVVRDGRGGEAWQTLELTVP